MQRIDALKAVARNASDLIIDSVPASLTATTMDISTLTHPQSGQLLGFTAYIYSGAGIGQSRIVASYSPTNKRLCFGAGFGSIPSTNSQVLLLKEQKEDYDNVISRHIGIAQLHYLQEKVATLALVASTYEYAVPSGYEYVHNLRLVPSGYSDYGADDVISNVFELPPQLWHIEINPLGSYIIAIDRRKIDLTNFDNEWVRISGQVKPDIQATDNANIPADLEEFVVAGATMQLAAQRISGTDTKWKYIHSSQRDTVSALEAYITKPRRGKRVG